MNNQPTDIPPHNLLDSLLTHVMGVFGSKTINYGDTQPATTTPKSAPVATSTPQLSISQQNYNPGNLVYAGQAGAVKGDAKPGGGFWAKFPDENTGYQALSNDNLAKLKRSPDMTVAQLLDLRSPPSENSSSTLHYNVMDALKDLKDSGKISTLMANKLLVKDVPMDRLSQAIAKAEGYKSASSTPPIASK
jgi:hypothetical protein